MSDTKKNLKTKLDLKFQNKTHRKLEKSQGTDLELSVLATLPLHLRFDSGVSKQKIITIYESELRSSTSKFYWSTFTK